MVSCIMKGFCDLSPRHGRLNCYTHLCCLKLGIKCRKNCAELSRNKEKESLSCHPYNVIDHSHKRFQSANKTLVFTCIFNSCKRKENFKGSERQGLLNLTGCVSLLLADESRWISSRIQGQ